MNQNTRWVLRFRPAQATKKAPALSNLAPLVSFRGRWPYGSDYARPKRRISLTRGSVGVRSVAGTGALQPRIIAEGLTEIDLGQRVVVDLRPVTFVP